MLRPMPDKPDQPPEGAAIQRAMVRERLSARQAAIKAGMSEGRWRQVVAGYQSARGQHIPVTAPAATLARMAQAVNVTSQELRDAGRDDAAAVLDDLKRDDTRPATLIVEGGQDEALIRIMRSDRLTEDQKRDLAKMLIAEREAADQQRAERADEMIRIFGRET